MTEWTIGNKTNGIMHKFKCKDGAWISIHFRDDGDIYIDDTLVWQNKELAQGMNNLDRSRERELRLLTDLLLASRDLGISAARGDTESLGRWRQALRNCRDIAIDTEGEPKIVLARPLYNERHDHAAWAADCPHCQNFEFEDSELRGCPVEERPKKCSMCETPIRIIYPWEIETGMRIHDG